VTAGIAAHPQRHPPGRQARQRYPERWQQVHDLRGKGAGLLECARRLGLSLNTVKR
jgi:DNA-binding NarL/FixJ family response regulator